MAFGRLPEAELAAVAPHRMQDYRQFARHRDHCPLMPAAALELHSPRLQRAPGLRSRHQPARGFIERRPEFAVALARDMPVIVDAVARLDALGRQPGIGADIARALEAGGVLSGELYPAGD